MAGVGLAEAAKRGGATQSLSYCISCRMELPLFSKTALISMVMLCNKCNTKVPDFGTVVYS